MSVIPSHRTAVVGGAWTALGFVPFDVWIGSAQPASAHLLGVLWMAMGVLFLWAPLRFLVAGRPIVDSLLLKGGTPMEAGSRKAIALRALTWIVSWSAFGVVLSMVALVLGHEEAIG
jgi:hypothetical protein